MTRILIFDDSKIAEKEYRYEIFKGRDVQLKILKTPDLDDRTLNSIQNFAPDLIIVDLALTIEIIDGLRLIRNLKGIDFLKKVPIAACSKYITSGGEIEAKAIKYGAIRAFGKYPYPKAEDFLSLQKKTEEEG